MEMSVGQIFKLYSLAEEKTKKILKEGQKDKNYGTLLVLRNKLYDLLKECQTPLEIPCDIIGPLVQLQSSEITQHLKL
jgi:hypothetical protein